jgi:hypothetical protein
MQNSQPEAIRFRKMIWSALMCHNLTCVETWASDTAIINKTELRTRRKWRPAAARAGIIIWQCHCAPVRIEFVPSQIAAGTILARKGVFESEYYRSNGWRLMPSFNGVFEFPSNSGPGERLGRRQSGKGAPVRCILEH